MTLLGLIAIIAAVCLLLWAVGLREILRVLVSAVIGVSLVLGFLWLCYFAAQVHLW